MIKMGRLASYCICLFAVCFWSCGDIENRGIDNREIAQEIKNREIKHITQAQITEAAFKYGSHIADTVQQALTRTMQKAVQQENLLEAAKYCNIQNLHEVNSLQDQYHAAIQRIRLKGQKKGQKLNEMEAQLMSAYRYNVKNNLPLDKNVQKLGTDYLLFTSPITINDEVCLKCHGKIGQEVSLEAYNQLKAFEDIDSLVNYSLRQPIGILSVLLQKKEIIKQISVE